jgi:hypothetical protein
MSKRQASGRSPRSGGATESRDHAKAKTATTVTPAALDPAKRANSGHLRGAPTRHASASRCPMA